MGYFKRNPKACLYFCDRENYIGLCIKGIVEVADDPDLKMELWGDGDERYYTGGVCDPDYIVLRFKSVSARLYNGSSSRDVEI